MARSQLIDSVREAAHLVGGTRRDYDPLLEMAEGAKFVLLGEASHGSHELYRQRARITQRLIAEQGFNGVCVEADWPDAAQANRWAQGPSEDTDRDAFGAGEAADRSIGDAADALSGFRRFPA